MIKRLSSLPTLRIDPESRVRFTYKKRHFYGAGGDTVATALYAAGVRIFGRSMKYHRPRGLYSMDGESSNTMMNVDGIPNMRAETTPLEEGMVVEEQNVLFSAKNDLLAFMDCLDRFMPAGFYYETMHKPAFMWPLAAEMVRKAAGLGRMHPKSKYPGVCDEIYPAADVCVVGGGPAGMSAALAAAENSMRVILIEARPRLGGSFDHRTAVNDKGRPLYEQAEDLALQVEKHPGIRVFTRTSMVGGYGGNQVTAVARGGPEDSFDYRYIEISAKSVVIATGARERPLIFENNERPGVMTPECALRLARTYGILPGRRAVFSVAHDSGLEAAVDLHDLGVLVPAVADVRQSGHATKQVKEIRRRGIAFYPGWAAAACEGKKQVAGVRLIECETGNSMSFSCDVLAAAAGQSAAAEPLSLFCGKLEYDGKTGYFLPRKYPPGIFAAGRILAREESGAIIASGKLAGLEAAEFCGAECKDDAGRVKSELEGFFAPEPASDWIAPPGQGRKSFVCFDEDVTVKNIKQAVERGFDVPELIKRFTAAGTGPGQGGIAGQNLPLLASALKKRTSKALAEKFSMTNVRPPIRPVMLAAYAGTGGELTKKTPLHDAQARLGAIFRRAGAWQRARYFSADLDVSEEVKNVRTNAGLLDASTLGNFRIFGPDALSALQRVYVGDISKIREGRVKYSAMCNHDGCLIDDWVVIKTGENDYRFTTSTGRAADTVEWIRYHSRFENWDFHVVNLTDGTGVINLAGPRARTVLEKLTDADVSDSAFPFGCWREFNLSGGIPVTCMRLGFVGELSFELSMDASFMQAAWDMLMEAGREFGLMPFGVEAQNILRLEKGHVILGQESEQRTNLLDLKMGFLWSRDKEIRPVGADALLQAENDPGRLKLAGIRMEDSSIPPPDGSIIVDGRVIGYIGTIRKSLALDAMVGMALVEGPWAREGSRLAVYDGTGSPGDLKYAAVVRMPFYDPEGKRMRI